MLSDAAAAGAPGAPSSESASGDPPLCISAEEFVGRRQGEGGEQVLAALGRAAEAVSRFDCSELAQLLHAKGFCDDLPCTRPLVLHFLRLLALIVIHLDDLAPPYICSQVLEDAWVAVLTLPRLYERICGLFLPSGIIAYSPFTPRLYGEDVAAYAKLKSKYFDTFGRQPGTLFWPKDVPTAKKRVFVQDSQLHYLNFSDLGALHQNPLFRLNFYSS